MPDQIPSFPEGWYFVASRKEILKKKLIEKIWMGEKIVAWCDDKERICVADAFCPHLGADLGPELGGVVRDGCLVCPFHGFEFDVSGKCVSTPFAPPPKTARLKLFETRDINGIIFAWWGIDGRPPKWSLPEYPEVEGKWSELAFQTIRFPGHPQETTENSVDLAHLRYVHGYDNVYRIEPLVIDGTYLRSSFNFVRIQDVAGIKIKFDVSAKANIYGFGFSNVMIHEKSIDMHINFYVLATPVDGKEIDMVLASQVKQIRKPKRMIVGLRFLPLNLRTSLMNRFILLMQRKDVMDDVHIWKNKRYVSQPRLCKSDGEIGRYRRYCKQFYS
ncbi:MAG: Rieske 2Fe-2S domain-containing protein [Bacteroidetes bacterium]|nr:Rieske 2Fe-2S domain-containing protein [Bacteroidota bacterium]